MPVSDYDPALLQAQLDDLRTQLDAATAWLRRLDLDGVGKDERLEALEQQLADIYATGADPRAGHPDWRYRTVYDWVEQWFSVHYARSVTGVGWCARWFDHPEALLRLSAMWRSWEHARRDDTTGIAVWLTSIADPLARELFDPAGTFRYCGRGEHRKVPEALPLEVRHES